ncbi:MAG: hypothetical protein LBJ78_02000 [Puniceicoccales bacterium]|nr:hypothetical protein [Puniceicoccales bacterium]
MDLFNFGSKDLKKSEAVLLIETFNKLIELNNGRKIVEHLHALIKKNKKSKIEVKAEAGTIGLCAGLTKDMSRKPYINGIGQLSESRPCCLLGLFDEKTKRYPVFPSGIPSCVALGHELIHLIDALEHEKAFIDGTRTVQDWIKDNQDNQLIKKIIGVSYFKEIFMSDRDDSVYEELYVSFGTNESRKKGITDRSGYWTKSWIQS